MADCTRLVSEHINIVSSNLTAGFMEKTPFDYYVDQLEREYYEELQADCDHDFEFTGTRIFMGFFHGYDERVVCKKCNFATWM